MMCGIVLVSYSLCCLIDSGKESSTVHIMMVFMHCQKSRGMCEMFMKDCNKEPRMLSLKAVLLKRN